MAEPGWETLGVGGALLARYRGDQQALVEQLATFLEGTLPRRTAVHRTLGILGPRHTDHLTVELGDLRFELRSGGPSIETTRTRIVRGVAVRNERLALEEWLHELGATLSAELERTEAGRAALSKLLDG